MLLLLLYLSRRKNGNIIFVNDSGLLLHHVRAPLFLQLFAGKPKENVLLTVFATEKGTKDFAADCKQNKREDLLQFLIIVQIISYYLSSLTIRKLDKFVCNQVKILPSFAISCSNESPQADTSTAVRFLKIEIIFILVLHY
jgi:hypothetical protein